MSWWVKIGVVSLVFFVGHCGYTLNHRLKEAFQYKNGIFIPVFDNSTDEIGAELVFTNALIRELSSRREVVISSRQDGGLELKGAITSIAATPTAYSEMGFLGLQSYRRLPSQLGVSVSIALTLVDPKNGSVLWTKAFSGFRRTDAPLNRTYDYQAPSSVGPFTQSVVEALYADIARDMMRDVYDEMVELF